MDTIRRIGSTDLSLSPRQGEKRVGTTAPEIKLVSVKSQPRASAGLHLEQPRTRPAANFLAQYIDQHMRWPRAPHRKDRQRQRATHAYINADMLPDLLAETLRLRSIDKNI